MIEVQWSRCEIKHFPKAKNIKYIHVFWCIWWNHYSVRLPHPFSIVHAQDPMAEIEVKQAGSFTYCTVLFHWNRLYWNPFCMRNSAKSFIAAPQLPMQRLRGLRMLPAADALINGVPARAHRKAAKFQIWGQTCAAQGHHTCSETSHHDEWIAVLSYTL